uniref:DUF4097 domain-containing protein n=1 Tax=candidate division WOR-3 bacterium TaxID=2052148 RepID=A0A7C4GE37_UNCW3
MRKLLRSRWLLPALGLAAICCLYLYRAESSETRTHAAAGIGSLNLSSSNGALTVSASADTLVTVRILRYCYGRDSADAARALENVRVEETLVGDQWWIAARIPAGRRAAGAEFTASCRAKTSLNLATSNGKIAVTGMTASVSATTSNGPITLSNCEGDADLATTNSPITLTGTSGSARLKTSNGKTVIQVHRGPVNVKTSNGEIDCDLSDLGPTQNAVLRTSNGKVTLRLPADVSALVDASTSNGSVTIAGFPSVTYELQERERQRARIGSGAATVTITTSNADVVIRAR